MESLLTTAARRHVRLLARALAPVAGRLERRFRGRLRELRYDAAHTRALLAISPVAAARARSISRFLEGVQYYGRRLAKLNMPLADVKDRMTEFDGIVCEMLARAHAPAREQLQLISAHALQEAYYRVREAEAQVFFGLAQAEAESDGLEDVLARMTGILTRAFPASAGRIVLLERAPPPSRARERYMKRPIEKWEEYKAFWSFPAGPSAVVQLAFDRPYPWLPRERTLMLAAAERCAAVIERVRMKSAMERLEAEARCAEDEERRRIGRELHDDTAQSLLLLRLQLEMMQREAPAGLFERLDQSRAITERAIEDLRRTIAALSPALLERLGLASALRQLAGRFRRSHPARMELRIAKSWEQLSLPAREVVYRVAQESLRNISKHSQATQVNLCLYSADKSFRLRVSDNGAGFSTQSAAGKPLSFGLTGMRERAELLGGSLEVRSRPGKGASVTLILPRTTGSGES
jgi:signal transduction histidine kinase